MITKTQTFNGNSIIWLYTPGIPNRHDPEADPWRVFTLTDAYLERYNQYIAAGLFPLPSEHGYGAPGTEKPDNGRSGSMRCSRELWLPPAAYARAAGFATKHTRQCGLTLTIVRPTHGWGACQGNLPTVRFTITPCQHLAGSASLNQWA